MKNTKKGFTLVELLVVIAILAILAGVGVAGYTAFIKDARDSNAQTELHQVESYIEADMLADNVFAISDTQRLYKDSTSGVVYQEYDATAKEWKTVAAETDITTSLQSITDFKSFKGTFKVKGNVITYTLTEGGSATATIN